MDHKEWLSYNGIRVYTVQPALMELSYKLYIQGVLIGIMHVNSMEMQFANAVC